MFTKAPYHRQCCINVRLLNIIAVFMNRSPEIYQQFATNLLLIARQLNLNNNQSSSSKQQPRPEAA